MNASAITVEARPWKQGALWLAVLGPFFFASYGLSNWIAGRRAFVPTVVFDWEHAIPFLAWTIVPYWVIDLCYAASLLLCATRTQLATHVKRLAAVQLTAVACFLVFPLRSTFERPPVEGVFGWMFAALTSFDLPYNQAPSLHIALLVVLWHFYRQVLPRRWHPALHAACLTIAISALTTWQHHFIDIPTGAWLGALCVFLLPDDARPPFAARLSPDPARRTLCVRYALGALGFAAVALSFGGTALWLLWPAGSMALVAAAYAFGRTHCFGKDAGGTMSPAAAALYAPYFLAAWTNSRLWTRSLPIADEVAPGVFLGRIPSRRALRALRVAAIVDLCAELPCDRAGLRHAHVPMLDLVVPNAASIQQAAVAIERARESGSVLVCCALGFSRSALALAAWLIRSGAAGTIDESIERIRRARPRIVLSAAHRAALAEWRRTYAADCGSAPAPSEHGDRIARQSAQALGTT